MAKATLGNTVKLDTPQPNRPKTQQDLAFQSRLMEHLRAGYQALYVHTTEERRATAEIRDAILKLNQSGSKLNYEVVMWDAYEGFSHGKLQGIRDYLLPTKALEAMIAPENFAGDVVFIMKDLDDFMPDVNVRRRIRTLTEDERLVGEHRRHMIIVSSRLEIHPKLRTNLTVLDFDLPGEESLNQSLDYIHQSTIKDPRWSELQEPAPEVRERIVANMRGMTCKEAENCISRGLAVHRDYNDGLLRVIKEEKASIIRKSEVLTYIDDEHTPSRDEIGGFDAYMGWLDRRRLAYSKAARAAGIDFPRGVVLLGLAGTGKSIMGFATCRILQLPGFRLDVGALFAGIVGETEARVRDTIRQIEAQKGCVVIIDEADKAFGNVTNSGGDSGVTKRVFGNFLSWLSEKQGETFVIMTLNRTAGLPPELFRPGRFDAVFYTDLPTAAARREILEIHLRKRHVDPATIDMGAEEWDHISNQTAGYVGAELEEVVRESRYLSWERRQSGVPTFEEMTEAVSCVKPMSQRDQETVDMIRKFCKEFGRPVTNKQDNSGGARRRSVRA